MKLPPPRRQRGVALLESMLAIVILGIGLMGTVGLQARAYSALSEASARAEATMAAEKLLGLMNADTGNLAAYALAENGVPQAALAPWVAETRNYVPNALISVVVAQQTRRAQVDISIKWTRTTGGAQNQHQLTSYIGL